MPVIVTSPYYIPPVDWTQTPTENLIVASDAAFDNEFSIGFNAESASMGAVFQTRNGQYLFVGASNRAVGANDNQGGVYVYEKIGGVWTEIQLIESPTAGANDIFGRNISTSADGVHVLIGGKFCNYFEKVGASWVHRQTIPEPEPGFHSGHFGKSISMSDDGTIALLGEYGYSQTLTQGYPSNISSTGKCYSYTRSGTTWSFDQAIDTPSPIANGRFGGNFTMSPDGTHCLIAQPAQPSSPSPDNLGRVWAYNRTGGAGSWTLNHELAKSVTVDPGQRFGRGVSRMTSDGNTIVIGTGNMNENGGAGPLTFVGGCLVYTRSGGTWTEQQVLQPPTLQSSGFAGDISSVSISNDGSVITMGGWNEDSGKGSCHVFQGTPGSYTESQRLVPSAGETDQNFGRCTQIVNNNELFVGSHQRSVTVTDQGVVYVYEI